MTQLSPHFSLEELTASQTAVRHGIDNTPDAAALTNLHKTAGNMELVRTFLGYPVHISSGFRCLKVNRLLKSKDTSAHVHGYAIDFTCPRYGSPYTIAHALITSDIKYDQLIHEFGSWVHISFDPRMRQQELTISHKGTVPGIVRI